MFEFRSNTAKCVPRATLFVILFTENLIHHGLIVECLRDKHLGRSWQQEGTPSHPTQKKAQPTTRLSCSVTAKNFYAQIIL